MVATAPNFAATGWSRPNYLLATIILKKIEISHLNDSGNEKGEINLNSTI